MHFWSKGIDGSVCSTVITPHEIWFWSSTSIGTEAHGSKCAISAPNSVSEGSNIYGDIPEYGVADFYDEHDELDKRE